jgi:hypothetical protein
MGIPVPGLVGELQPVVDYLTPHISNAKDFGDKNLQLLRDLTRLGPVIPQLKALLYLKIRVLTHSRAIWKQRIWNNH